jgi:hypothetical protein
LPSLARSSSRQHSSSSTEPWWIGNTACSFPRRLIAASPVPKGLDRSRARATVGGGFPAPPFRLRGGFTFPPWSTFPEAPVVIPDGRISRVRLATMTFGCSLPIASRWFKCSPTCALETPVYCNARYACNFDPPSQVQSPDGCPNVPAMTESPFASSRCYLVNSGVYRHLGQRYPALIARRTHAPDLCPLVPFAFARSTSPCRLL